MRQKKTSFTLIEMLVVIVIIGILAAALVPRLQSVQARARDSKRKVDLRTIYNALEIYILDNSDYPSDRTPGAPAQRRHSYDAQPRMPELTGIIASIPVDPINTTTAGHPRAVGRYNYIYFQLMTGSLKTYDLATQLENTQDPDRAAIQGRKLGPTQTYVSLGGAGGQVFDMSPNVPNK